MIGFASLATRSRRLSAGVGLLLFLAFGARVSAQTSVLSGLITDAQGARISRAAVTVYTEDSPRRIQTTADEQGVYRLVIPRPGTYLFLVESPGFASSSRRLFVAAGTDVAVDVVLQVNGIREQIIVTASGTPQLARGASKTVSVVTREEIDNRSESSLAEALRTIPGVRVQQRGGPGTHTTIKFRGLRGQDTAVLIDGSRFRDAGATQGDATTFIQDLTVLNVDRIEVLRGSGSSLHGSHAMGGVVNIVPQVGQDQTRGRGAVEGGSLGFFRSLATLSGSLARSRVRYSAGIGHTNVTQGVDGDDEARNTSGQGRVSVAVGNHGELIGQVLATNASVQLNDSPFTVSGQPRTPPTISAVPLPLDQQRLLEAGQPFSTEGATFVPALNDPDSKRRSRLFAGTVRFEGHAGERINYGVRYARVNTHRRFLDGPEGARFEPDVQDLTEITGHVDTLSGRLDVRATSRQLVTVGYELERDRYRNEILAPAPQSLVGITQRSQAVFAQDQVALSGKLTLAVSGRLQTFDLSTPTFVPAEISPYEAVPIQSPPTAYTGAASRDVSCDTSRWQWTGQPRMCQ